MGDVSDLPVLVARFDETSVADYLLGAARMRSHVFVPLVAPPETAAMHRLHVYIADNPEPVVMLAQPLGGPTPQGCPLELSMPAPRHAIPPALGHSSPPAVSYGDYQVEVTQSTAPPATTSSRPDWLEEGRGQLIPSLAPSMPPPRSPGSDVNVWAKSASSPPMAEVSQAVTDLLQTLARTQEPERFLALVAPLEAKLRGFIDAGDIAAARRVHATLEMIAHEPAGPRSRAPHAEQALRIFASPAVLGVLATRSLDGVADRDGQASKLLARAGNRGAHALYSARVADGAFDARSRFIGIMLAIGPAALPTVRAALERLEPRIDVPGAFGLVEDVLRSVPDIEDDALGQVIARYARMPHVTVALAATEALPRAWREKARPSLIAQLRRTEDDVCIAALKNLRELGGVDAVLFVELRLIVLGMTPTRNAVRIAAAEALADTTVDMRPYAQALLTEAFVQTTAGTPELEDFVLVLADTLLHLGGDAALVVERCRRSPPSLRGRLEVVLSRRSVRGF